MAIIMREGNNTTNTRKLKYLLKSGAIELESVIVELLTTSFEDELKPLGFRIISSLIHNLNKSFIKLPFNPSGSFDVRCYLRFR